MTRIKLCGMTNAGDIRLCAAAGADALGFVVEYPVEVPWNLDRATAEDLMSAVPPFVSRVIVVGDDFPTVVALTERLRPHAVQLHGGEPVPATAALVAAVHALGAQALKVLRFSVETGRCRSRCEDPVDAAREIEDTGADALVLDAMSATRPAGTGRTIDWGLARKIRDGVRIPVILAGGLNAGNVGGAVAAVDPYGVDVISGVEEPVRKKDPEKVRAFIEAVAAARRETTVGC